MNVLRLGSKGDEVRSIQNMLVGIGKTIDVDGDFGPKTEAAVKAFQAGQGLDADGIVGDKTLTALQEAYDVAHS